MIGWRPQSTNPNLASYRYRCLNPMTELQKQGYPVELYQDEHLDRYNAVIFSKRYGREDKELAKALKIRKLTILLDLCDNHFYNPFDLPKYRDARNNLIEMIGLADVIICSTEALAVEVAREANLAVLPSVVGDAVEAFPVSQRSNTNGHTSLLWFGMHGSPNAPSGMLDVLRLQQLLKMLNHTTPLEVVIASNCKAKFDKHLANLPFSTRYVDWSREIFPSLLAEASAVIIPICVNPFTACKTNNRAATALFAGVPVVADSIPSYQELDPFCFLDNWEFGLKAIIAGAQEAWQRTREGQEYVRRHYLIPQIARRWATVLSRAVLNT